MAEPSNLERLQEKASSLRERMRSGQAPTAEELQVLHDEIEQKVEANNADEATKRQLGLLLSQIADFKTEKPKPATGGTPEVLGMYDKMEELEKKIVEKGITAQRLGLAERIADAFMQDLSDVKEKAINLGNERSAANVGSFSYSVGRMLLKYGLPAYGAWKAIRRGAGLVNYAIHWVGYYTVAGLGLRYFFPNLPYQLPELSSFLPQEEKKKAEDDKKKTEQDQVKTQKETKDAQETKEGGEKTEKTGKELTDKTGEEINKKNAIDDVTTPQPLDQIPVGASLLNRPLIIDGKNVRISTGAPLRFEINGTIWKLQSRRPGTADTDSIGIRRLVKRTNGELGYETSNGALTASLRLISNPTELINGVAVGNVTDLTRFLNTITALPPDATELVVSPRAGDSALNVALFKAATAVIGTPVLKKVS